MPDFPPARKQLEELSANAAEVIPADELLDKLERSRREGRPLRVKLGIDPSRPDLTLGHAVVLGKLRQFQDLGHTAVLIIGDFTGLVGDPSGQSETRPMLTPEQMEENARTYFEQAGLVVDMRRAEVRRNSEWLGAMSMSDVLELTSHATVARMLERDDFQARFREGRPISVVELLYPVMQAMDSVATRADVELGGTDQTFNLLMGRDVQRAYGQDPQVVLTMPLLEGLDGVRKMSKSLDNYVGLTDPPQEMFGRLMSLRRDELIGRYLRLAAGATPEEADAVEEGLRTGSLHPNAAKRDMARRVVARFHGPDAPREAEAGFDRVHREHELPVDVPEGPMEELSVLTNLGPEDVVWLPKLLYELGFATSNSQGRRLIEQGGVRVDGDPVAPDRLEWPLGDLTGKVIQVGRRKFVRITGPGSAG
jgi:tyrosyl-tRNA synthetase